MSPADQLEVASDRQDKDQGAVTESTEEGQEVVKVRDSASDTSTDTHDDQTDDGTVNTLHELAAASHSNTDQTLKLQGERCQ